jgi:hypothetical protein
LSGLALDLLGRRGAADRDLLGSPAEIGVQASEEAGDDGGATAAFVRDDGARRTAELEDAARGFFVDCGTIVYER